MDRNVARIRMPNHDTCNAWCRDGLHAQLVYFYETGPGYIHGPPPATPATIRWALVRGGIDVARVEPAHEPPPDPLHKPGERLRGAFVAFIERYPEDWSCLGIAPH